MLAWGPGALGDHSPPEAMLTASPGSRPQVLDPESPGSWNSQKQMLGGGKGAGTFPSPMVTKSPGTSSAPLSHLTIASFLSVGENKQAKS